METLIKYLDTHKPRGFTPGQPCYIPENDSFLVFVGEEPSYAKRMDEFVTLHLSFDDKQVLGLEVKGVKRHLETAIEFRSAGCRGHLRYMLKAMAMDRSMRNPETKDYFKQMNSLADNAVSEEADRLVSA